MPVGREAAPWIQARTPSSAISTRIRGDPSGVRLVGDGLRPRIPVVVDTPIAPTRGRSRLLATDAVETLKGELLPRATLVTVNVDEARALLGEPVRSVSEAHDAARALAALGPRAALVKGGHLAGANAVDVLAVQGEVIELRARRLPIGPTHGSGCTFASLIAGRLAAALPGRVDRDALVAAVRWAKRVHHAALARAVDVSVDGRGLRVIVF